MNGIIESQPREIDHTIAGDEQFRRDQLLFQEQLSEQNRDLREAHTKSPHEMEELRRVQELRIDEFSRRRLIENQDIIHELTARIQELQNEVNCMNGSRDFWDAESVRSGPHHVPSQPALFPLYIVIQENAKPLSGNAEPQRWAAKSFPSYRDPGGMLSRLGGLLNRNDKPPDIWNTNCYIGKRFL